MSVNAVMWAMSKKIKCVDKMVLLVLCKHISDEEEFCNPGIVAIADDCGLSVRAVQRSINRLLDDNYIFIAKKIANQHVVYSINGCEYER